MLSSRKAQSEVILFNSLTELVLIAISSIMIIPPDMPRSQVGIPHPDYKLWKAKVKEVRTISDPKHGVQALLRVSWYYSKSDLLELPKESSGIQAMRLV